MKEESIMHPGIEYDPYDVNLIKTLKTLENAVASKSRILKSEVFDKENYFIGLWSMAEYFYKSLKPGSPWRFNFYKDHLNSGILIVPSDHVFFQYGITFDLIARDDWEINAFLDYHAENLIGFDVVNKENFPVFIEKLVLRHISTWSPFLEDSRKGLIMQWVKKVKDSNKSVGEEVYKNHATYIFNQLNIQMNSMAQEITEGYTKEFNEFKDALKNLTGQIAENKKGKNDLNNEITSFEELFKNPLMIDSCIDVLRKTDPPLISNESKYIGKSKSAFGIWFSELEIQGYIENINDTKKALLLTKYFSGFTTYKDGSILGKIGNKTEEKYRFVIKKLLSEIPKGK